METSVDFVKMAKIKASFATCEAQIEYAISDCHDTLRVCGLPYEHPYCQKLWAEIDAYRDRSAAIKKGNR